MYLSTKSGEIKKQWIFSRKIVSLIQNKPRCPIRKEVNCASHTLELDLLSVFRI